MRNDPSGSIKHDINGKIAMTAEKTDIEQPSPGKGEDPDAEIERLWRTVELFQGRIKRLEEENALFADMLKERGVDVCSRSQIALELPPPISIPKNRNDVVFTSMTDTEQALFNELAGNDEIFILLKTNSSVDTGNWLRKRRVWIGVTADSLFMFAQGRKPMIEKVELNHLQQSLYNHVMGELILSPTRELKIASVRISHEDGYRILAQIYRKKSGERNGSLKNPIT